MLCRCRSAIGAARSIGYSDFLLFPSCSLVGIRTVSSGNIFRYSRLGLNGAPVLVSRQ